MKTSVSKVGFTVIQIKLVLSVSVAKNLTDGIEFVKICKAGVSFVISIEVLELNARKIHENKAL